jgi:hypothetical protein
MVKVKKDIVINGVTYKDIQLSQWSGDSYNIDTAGIATVIRQFIKNNYGDIKVWARSKSFAGGSSVDIYLWNVPIEWYNKIESFADSFGMYNEYDGGDGYWRGKSMGASLPDGTPVGNYSPYMHVSNTPPWDAKEKDMTPPDYSKSQKKSFPKKGGFPKKESKTADFTLVHDCGNGWKVFEKYNENEAKPYTYRVVKDYDTKPVGKDDFYALKGKMLDEGFLWAIKVQCFERNNVLQLSNFDLVCSVLSDYFPMKEQPKTENKTEPTHDFKVGDLVTTTQKFEGVNKVGDLVSVPEIYMGRIVELDPYDNTVVVVNYTGEENLGMTIATPINFLKKWESKKKEEPKSTTDKVPIKSIKLIYDDEEFDSFNALDAFLKVEYYENSETKLPSTGYDKYKIEFIWQDGSRIVDRIDIGKSKGDYNPFKETLSEYYAKQSANEDTFSVMYEIKLQSPFKDLSFDDIVSTETTKEVSLEQLLNDMAILLDLEEDLSKKAELQQYIEDLQVLASLNN